MMLLRHAANAALVCLAALVVESIASPSISTHSGANASCFDFIIVGGGTAGNAVATRLSQYLPQSSILIIEAGSFAPYEDGINIPGLVGATFGTAFDWNFTSIPQPQLYNRTIAQFRGKVLGGSSALNYLIWDRGAKPDYDAWEKVGNPGWNWELMKAAMDKAENFLNPGPPFYTATGEGTQGPIHAVLNRFIPVQQQTWIPTLENLGVQLNSEWMAGENVGVSYQTSSINPKDYNRSYSAVAYLPHAGPNLAVWTNTQVAKVNLEQQGGVFVITGVTLINGDIVTANKEVILSAGSIQSPQLLELSGIGDSEVVEAAGVETKINLTGVGENLQDHPRIQASYLLKKSNYTSLDKFKYNSTYAAEQLALFQAGELSAYDDSGNAFSFQTWQSVVGNDSAIIDRAEQAAKEANNVVNDKKLTFLTNANFSSTIAQVELALSDVYIGDKGYPAVGTPLYGANLATILGALMHPLSQGSVHINSSNATAHPVYNPAFLSNEYDVQGLIAIAKYIRKMAQTAPFSEIWTDEYEPGLDVVQTDEQWREYVLNNTQPFYHPVGTCAMLPREVGGVVDPNLTVYGTANLRIVDASIIPILVSAHPQNGVYGIAERAAEIISAAWS